MYLIDTHSHIYLDEFDSDRDEVIKRALEKGVIKMLMPNIDTTTLPIMLSLSKRYKGICFPMTGLHPTNVSENYKGHLNQLEDYLNNPDIIAIGETGIDLYRDKSFTEEQIIAFRIQASWAVETGLPLIIHSRNAFREIFEVLSEFRKSRLKGIFHAFSGDFEIANRVIEAGFKLGISGVVTFKNSVLPNIIKEAGLENIVLETDSPYLAPFPFRGKRNESSYICIINSAVAKILGMKEEQTAEITTQNAKELFNLNG